MGIANDYTPNVDDLTAPTQAHPAFRIPDEVRLLKQRVKPLYDTATSLNTAVASAQAAQLAAELAQSLAEAARDAAAISDAAANASEAAALASENAAAASESNAADASALAMLWAAAPYGQEVVAGSGLYSALHYAQEALNIIAGGFIDDSAVSTQKSYSSSKIEAVFNQLNTLTGLGITASADEINYVGGVTSSIQAQLNGKATAAQGDKADAALPEAQIAGAISFFACNTAPTGWLKANGAAISRTTYAVLFAAIGTTFGAGDGSTTFNLPDLRGEFLRAWDDGRTVDNGRGFGTWQDSGNRLHNHGGGTGGQSNDHAHFTTAYAGLAYGASQYTIFAHASDPASTPVYTGGATQNHSHGINGDGLNEARPRNIALLACIKY